MRVVDLCFSWPLRVKWARHDKLKYEQGQRGEMEEDWRMIIDLFVKARPSNEEGSSDHVEYTGLIVSGVVQWAGIIECTCFPSDGNLVYVSAVGSY
jgi:hypothetical protein